MMYIIFMFCLLLLVLFLIANFAILSFGYVEIKSNICLLGKTALVTGGSCGIGYEIVLALASRGCRVIVVDKIINEEIRNSIIDETNNSNILLEYADFASFNSVRKLAVKLRESESKLDILINNVGIGRDSKRFTEDGLNMTMQINYYSPFLLTHLVVNLLKNSKEGRVIFTTSLTSFVHIMISKYVTTTTIKNPPPLLRIFDYPNSKFCIIASTKIFAEKFKKLNITANVYHPGLAKTGIWHQPHITNIYIIDLFLYYGGSYPISEIFGTTAKKACKVAVELAISKEFKNVNGIFFGKMCPQLHPWGTNDAHLCHKIWQATEKIVQLKPDEKLE